MESIHHRKPSSSKSEVANPDDTPAKVMKLLGAEWAKADKPVWEQRVKNWDNVPKAQEQKLPVNTADVPDPTFECVLCDEVLTSRGDLKENMKSHMKHSREAAVVVDLEKTAEIEMEEAADVEAVAEVDAENSPEVEDEKEKSVTQVEVEEDESTEVESEEVQVPEVEPEKEKNPEAEPEKEKETEVES